MKNADWLEADVTDLRDLQGSTFDAVVCSAGLLSIPAAKCLDAWHRLLKTDGVMAFSTMRAGMPHPAVPSGNSSRSRVNTQTKS